MNGWLDSLLDGSSLKSQKNVFKLLFKHLFFLFFEISLKIESHILMPDKHLLRVHC